MAGEVNAARFENIAEGPSGDGKEPRSQRSKGHCFSLAGKSKNANVETCLERNGRALANSSLNPAELN